MWIIFYLALTGLLLGQQDSALTKIDSAAMILKTDSVLQSIPEPDSGDQPFRIQINPTGGTRGDHSLLRFNDFQFELDSSNSLDKIFNQIENCILENKFQEALDLSGTIDTSSLDSLYFNKFIKLRRKINETIQK